MQRAKTRSQVPEDHACHLKGEGEPRSSTARAGLQKQSSQATEFREHGRGQSGGPSSRVVAAGSGKGPGIYPEEELKGQEGMDTGQTMSHSSR